MIGLPEILQIPGAPVEALVFASLAFAAIVGAISVVTSRDPFISALSLIINFASLGIIYLMLNATFVAVSQVIVYAGAVVVMFLFVLAYLGDRREIAAAATSTRWLAMSAVGAALTLSVLVGLVAFGGVGAGIPDAGNLPEPAGNAAATYGGARGIGIDFLSRYILAFEVTSLVLLVAAVGGVTLGLTGRNRHRKLRSMMGAQSADQVRRRHGQSLSHPEGDIREGAAVPTTTNGHSSAEASS